MVFDRNDRFLAAGLYDPGSPIRIRVLHAGSPVAIDPAWFALRLDEALALRAGLGDPDTDGLRLLNGESDRFPGLVLDRYAGTLVLKLYSAVWFPWLEAIQSLIRERIPAGRLVLRLSRNVQNAARGPGLAEGQALFGEAVTEPVVFLESGLRFEADVVRGQKTGFFLDQRENRRIVEGLARGGHVLNAFSFSSGFSVYAARGGARSVTDVDISAHALESGRRNLKLNHAVAGGAVHESIQADVFEWLERPPARRFDLVILDPPSLAQREAGRGAALRAYGALAAAGSRIAAPDGSLVCCSCSGHVTAEEFFGAVTSALESAGRTFEVFRQTHEPPDHHATFPEARYLKAIYLRLKSGRRSNVLPGKGV